MEPKLADVMAAFPTCTTESHAASSIISMVVGGDFGRIPSEWDLEEYVNKAMIIPEITNGSANEEDVKPGEFRCQRDKSFPQGDALFDSVCSDDLDAAFRNPVSALFFLESLTVSGQEARRRRPLPRHQAVWTASDLATPQLTLSS